MGRLEKQLRKDYGIGVEYYQEMVVKQNYVCAICFTSNPKKRLSVDHCHTSGLIRGLLCQKCNVGLGYFKDNINLLNNAAKYLSKNSKKLRGNPYYNYLTIYGSKSTEKSKKS